MKRNIIVVLMLALIAWVPFAIRAEEKAKSFTGEPIDLACYLVDGHNSASCARNCVGKKGQPAGFLIEENGKKELYLVMTSGGSKPSEIFAELWGKKVKATGEIVEREGLRAIIIEKAEEAK